MHNRRVNEASDGHLTQKTRHQVLIKAFSFIHTRAVNLFSANTFSNVKVTLGISHSTECAISPERAEFNSTVRRP